MKDVPTQSQPGLGLAAILKREDVRDAFISLKHQSIADLPQGATVGTSSLRRQAQILRRRPDLRVIGFRGNVETRLAKLEQGIADATFLAVAGLNRLGLAHRITSAVDTDTMLPAVAQGAIGIECRTDDARTRSAVAALDHDETARAVRAERAALARLDGSCRTPIAALARIDGNSLRLDVELVAPDGRDSLAHAMVGPASDPERIGRDVAERLLSTASPALLAAIGHDGRPRGGW